MARFLLLTITLTFFMSFLKADDVESFLEKTRQKHMLPSLGGAVTINGKIVFAEVTGFRKFGATIKATVNDKFHIGSCTKSMTATLAGILVDQKKVKIHAQRTWLYRLAP